jgi:hypothetical protein
VTTVKVLCASCGEPTGAYRWKEKCLRCADDIPVYLRSHLEQAAEAHSQQDLFSKPLRYIQGRIYVARARDTDLFKLGWSKDSPAWRVVCLEKQGPFKLDLIVDFPGHRGQEHQILEETKQHQPPNVRGEWRVFDKEQLRRVLDRLKYLTQEERQ